MNTSSAAILTPANPTRKIMKKLSLLQKTLAGPVFAATVFAGLSMQSAQAADATWNSPYNGSWATGSNPPWSTGAAPGASSGTTSTDTATFNLSGSGSSIITVDAARNIKNITFSTTSGVDNFQFTGGALQLTSGGTIQTSSGYTGAADFSTGLTLNGGYTLDSSGAVGSALNFNTITTAAGLTTPTLTLTGSNTGLLNTVQGVISQGVGTVLSVSKTGTGTWVLNGANTYTGGTSLNGGMVVLGSATALGSSGTINVAGNTTVRQNVAADLSGRITINDGATLTLDTNNTAETYVSAFGNSGVSNTAGLTKTGLGILTLSTATQTYKGDTTINAGQLLIQGNNTTNLINSSSRLVLGGGQLDYKGTAATISTQTFNGTVLNAGISLFIPNSGTGNNTIDFGAITRNSGAAFNLTTTTGYVLKATGTTLDGGNVVKGVFISGNDFATVSSGNLTAAAYTTQNAAGSWTGNTTNYVTNGAVSGTVGTGGTVTINGLKLNNASTQSFGINGTLVVNDGIIFASNLGAFASEISGGNLTGPSGSTGSSDLIIVNNSTQATYGRSTVSSTIVNNGSATNLILYGANTGSLFISGTNTYTGNTYVAGGQNTGAGVVVVGGAAGARIGSANATVFINGGQGGLNSTLRVGNGDATGDVLGKIQVDNGNLSLNRTDTNTLSATVSGVAGGGYITLANTGNTTLNFASGSNTFQLLQSSAAGTLNLGGAGSVNTFINTAPFGTSALPAFSASSTVNFNSGTYIFNGPANNGNNRTGTWNVQGATVQILGGRYWNSAGGTVGVSSGTLQFGGDRLTLGEQQGSGTANIINVSGTGLLDVGAGSGSAVTVGSAGAITQDSTSSATINQSGGTVQIGVNDPLANTGSASGQNLIIGNGLSKVVSNYNLSGGTLRVAGTISGAALGAAQTGNMSFTSGSNVALTAANNTHYVGEVLSGTQATNAGVSGATITAISGLNITLSANATATVAAAPTTGQQQQANLSRAFNWTGGTLTAGGINMSNLGTNNGVNSVSANFTGTGTLYQGGATSIMAPGDTFGGVTYTGKTAITGNYQIDNGAVAIGIGGTTAATGFHSNAAGTFDNISVSGTTVLGGALTANLLSPGGTTFIPTNANSFDIINSTGAVSGTFTNAGGKVVLGNDPFSGSLSIVVGANKVTLNNYTANEWLGTGGGGSWGTGGTSVWTNSVDPNAVGAGAKFGSAGSANTTVTLDANRTVGQMLFSSANYTIGGSSTLTLDNGASAAAITLQDATTQTISAPITLNSDLTVTGFNGGTLVLGSLTGAAKNLTANTSGSIVTLTGTNTYSNTTIASGVTLNVGNGGGSGSLGSGTTTNAGTLNFSRTGSLSVGSVINGAGNVNQIGSGTTTLTSANGYTGTTAISNGTLKLSGSGTLGGSTSTLGVIASGAVLDLNGTSQTVAGFSGNSTGQIQNNSGSGTSVLTIGGSSASSFAGVIADNNTVSTGGKVGLTLAGTGAVTLSGANTYSGGTIVGSNSTLTIGGVSTNSGATITSGPTGTGNVSFASGASIANPASGNSWYLPTLSLSGTLNLVNVQRLNTTFKTLELNSGNRTVNVNGFSKAVSGGNTLASEGTGQSVWELTTTTALGSVVQNGTLDLQTSFTGANYGLIRINNATSFSNADVNIGNNVILLTGQAGTLGANATTSPNVTISSAGILNLVSSTAAGRNINVKSLAGAGTVFGSMVSTTPNASTLTLNGISGSTDFSGTISNGASSGALGLTKSGASTQILSGTNTYTGNTTVSAGTLLINGSTGASAFAVNGTGTLGGNGTIGGSVTINSGGTLSPGNSPGLLTISGALTLGGTVNMEIATGTRGTAYDAVDVGASQLLTYGGTLTLTMASAVADATYNLFSFTSKTGNFSSIAFAGGYYSGTFGRTGDVWTSSLTNGQIFTFDQASGDLIAAVPEPATWALLAFSLTTIVILRRRSRA